MSGAEAVEIGLAERLAPSGQVREMAVSYIKGLSEAISPAILEGL